MRNSINSIFKKNKKLHQGINKLDLLDHNPMLFEFGKELIAELDVAQVLKISMDRLIQISNAERGMIILFDENKNSIFETARHLDKKDIKDPKFEVSRTIIDSVKSTGQSVCLKNALEEYSFKKSKSVAQLRILSIICLPLKFQNTIFGVIYLDNRSIQGVFQPKTFEIISAFSDFISLAAYNALEKKQLKNGIDALESELRGKCEFESIIGSHPKMLEIYKLVSQVADTDAIVLIQGESGSGKELIARALHFNSRRKDKPFVPINCGALPDNLLESELFGHVRGAFTGAIQDKAGWFQQAEGGTIFLDEVSEMSPALQVKLLRVLQTGEFIRVGETTILQANVRIVAATNKKLDMLVDQGVFRDDLYYRLKVIDIEIPPLRERKSDIPLLIDHFIELNCEQYSKKQPQLSREAEAILLAYDYPGNCRELENIIQHAVILSKEKYIYPEHLPKCLYLKAGNTPTSSQFSTFKIAKARMIEKFEREYIIDCLKATKGNISRAADMAGLNLKNFYEKMKKYGIDPSAFKP